MVWLIESTFQFSGQSNFLNEKTPSGMQKLPSNAIKRPNCSHKARNGGGRQVELSQIVSNGARANTNSSPVVSGCCKYVCFNACVESCSFGCPASILLLV